MTSPEVSELLERIDRRMSALDQLFHHESMLFADQDGTWTIPMLRGEIRQLATALRARSESKS